MLRKKYIELVKKYDLPSFDALDKEFQITLISKDFEEINFPLRIIRKKMNEKLVMFADGLQHILSPSASSPISLQEAKFFTEDDKDYIIDVIKQIMQIERHSLLLDVESTDRDEAEWIKYTYKKWLTLKKHLVKFVEIIRDGWQEEEQKSNQNYFG